MIGQHERERERLATEPPVKAPPARPVTATTRRAAVDEPREHDVADDPARSVMAPAETRIRRSTFAARTSTTAVIQRRVAKGTTWTTGKMAGVTGGGWLSWSQSQIDAKFDQIGNAHDLLAAKIQAAKDSGSKLTDQSAGTRGISSAEAVHRTWDRTIEWTDGDRALKELGEAIAAMDGVSATLADRHRAETEALQKDLGDVIADVLLETRSPKEVRALAGRVGVDVIQGLQMKKKATSDLLTDLSSEALLITLGPFGGPRLVKLFRSIPNLPRLAAGSNHQQVADVVDVLSADAVDNLASQYNAVSLKRDLLDPAGEEAVEVLAADLKADEIKQVVKELRVDRVKSMVGTAKNSRAKKLHLHRAKLRGIARNLADADDIVTYWNGLSTAMLEKLWTGKADNEVADVLDEVGPEALRALLPTMTQDELFDHATRLTNTGLQGFGKAMKGSELLTVTKPAAAATDPAAPADALLTTLGTDHASSLKNATTLFGDIDTLNLVLRRCAAHIDAAETAQFLDDAVANRWKKRAELKAFFDKAAGQIVRLVDLAKDFVADGNDGTAPEIAGAANPATAVHSLTIGTTTWKVAQGDVKHFMSGHTYVRYAMTDGNASRGDSTMWPTGTDRATVEADASTVLNSAGFAAFVNGAAAGYSEQTIGGFRVGIDTGLKRMTKLFPSPGTRLVQADMEAVVKLFKSKP